MRMKVSNYISEMLVKAGIHQAFMVTGGGAMHLDDALGHQEGLHCIYDHHEQACAIAAEAYARIHNEMAALCVTTGPGGTNAVPNCFRCMAGLHSNAGTFRTGAL